MSPTFRRMMVLVALVVLVTSSQTPPRIAKAAPAVGAQEDAELLKTRTIVTQQQLSSPMSLFHIIKQTSQKPMRISYYKFGISDILHLDTRLQDLQRGNPNLLEIILLHKVPKDSDICKCFGGLLRKDGLLEARSSRKSWYKAANDEEAMKNTLLCERLRYVAAEAPPTFVPKSSFTKLGNVPGYIYILGTLDPQTNECRAKVGVSRGKPCPTMATILTLQCGNPNILKFLIEAHVNNVDQSKYNILEEAKISGLKEEITGAYDWYTCKDFDDAKRFFLDALANPV